MPADYVALAKFLIEPLINQSDTLSNSESNSGASIDSANQNANHADQPVAMPLRIDCEPSSHRTWIRVAFDPKYKGKVLGKGGKTIQSIRQLLNTAAKLTNHRVSIEVYDPSESINSTPPYSGRSATTPKPLKLKS
ncbi:MAG: KH domain-containing protein [Pseudanabaenaceae cyanobacterium bins.68]|nr:KH domain-containing protein [Pseudanabaenaceae cyanobacterium bins.68]